jgi:hypothetical protein
VLILYTGGNTSFNGFPFLASFVAEDAYLPKQLTRRGHRLAFSNGIIVLTVVAVALLLATGARSPAWSPSTPSACSPASPWPGRAWSSTTTTTKRTTGAGASWSTPSPRSLTALIVLIFATVKFTEGAWVVVSWAR